jgi:hypothetical protein
VKYCLDFVRGSSFICGHGALPPMLLLLLLLLMLMLLMLLLVMFRPILF